MTIRYKNLTAGNIRQAADQVRRTYPYGPLGPRGCGDDKDFSSWQPVRLIGRPILPSDLFVAEFRREVAVD
jgi:hypothetical protein